ncbi:keratin-associated protein 16-1 [Hyalella azteca]|uniref:Keratin-associated protein 16-1 n=1 Tax=Hyalella azteca TaxID=294128 RepID=A0A8B7PMN8_HYAAZ|nr:keratin-associated protein 16-1 [Hyalella azteca]
MFRKIVEPMFVISLLMVSLVTSEYLPPIEERDLPTVGSFCSTHGIAIQGDFCASCKQPVYCDPTATPTVTVPWDECDDDYVCEEFSPGLATCVPSSTATTCACTSNMCDPYSPSYAAACNAGALDNIVDCATEAGTQTCAYGLCIDCTKASGEWYIVTPDCNAGYLCVSGSLAATQQCKENEYLTSEGKCESAPPPPCLDSCSRNCPDPTNCKQYYYCDGDGGVLSGPFTCDPDEYFDTATKQCAKGDSSVCDPLTQCAFAQPLNDTLSPRFY